MGTTPTRPFDKVSVAALRARAAAILGSPELDALLKSHREGDPKVRHRLADQIVRLEDAAGGRLSPIAEDAAGVTATEVDSVLTFAEDWQSSTAWLEVLRSLRLPGEYLHAVGTLAVASLLRVHHPKTDIIVAPGKSRRMADLQLSVPDVAPMKVEVKAPLALWQPTSSLDLGQAAQIARRAIDKAGTNVGGQLPQEHPGILAIAGLLMSQQTYDALVTGCEIVLKTDGHLMPQLLGLAVCNLRQGAFPEGGRVSITLEQQSVLRRNPSYTGNLWIDNDWSKSWSVVER
jgi:hypothetical protein